MQGRDILVYLSFKYQGQFEKILAAVKAKEEIKEEDINNTLKKINANYITILDSDYPVSLKQMYMPPFVIYYYGDKSLLNSEQVKVAVIGSRESSSYGESITRDFVKSLSSNQRVIVSGMARGIDTIAHETCINNKGKTIAVLGSGIDYPYPKSNKDLYETLKKDHLIISEYPNFIEPKPEQFPMRNRIVAAIADKILVTEAYVNSGTNITVLHALRLGKDVMAVPYEANKNSSCNRLIQDGAILVDNPEDVLYHSMKKN